MVVYFAGFAIAVLLGHGVSWIDHNLVGHCSRRTTMCPITYFTYGIFVAAWTLLYFTS